MSDWNPTPEQQAAVENRGGSLLVSAAAGSGKTKVLVERVFRYVMEDRCNINDFLMITYTKAAAAELRSKIAAELSRRLAASPEDAHLRRQLLLVYQADIKTVDAFCAGLLRENTHLLAREGDRNCLSPDFRVLDEDEAQLLQERVLNRVLEDFYGDPQPGDQLLADTLGFGRDDRALADLTLKLYNKIQSHARPTQWLAENDDRWRSLRAGDPFDETVYCGLLLQEIGRKGRYWSSLLLRAAGDAAGSPLEKGYADRFAEAAEGLSELYAAAESGRWDGTREAAERVTFRSLSTPKGMKDDPLAVRMKNLWAGCKEDLKKSRALLGLSGEEAMEDLSAVAPAMEALLRLTASFAEAYRVEKLRRNAADFSDQEHLALQILVDGDNTPTELGRQVSARYTEILVDEYQDTNEVQNAIFRAVSRDGKNLFTVGDVKQSIYRFRLADPTIFLEKYNTFGAPEAAEEGQDRKILLSKNFRSRGEILDAANFVFAAIMSPEMGEMEYGDQESLHFGAAYYPERTDCAVEYHLICAQQKTGEERPVKKLTAEARFAALRLRQLLDSRFPVTDGDGTLRPCRPEDAAILMRSPGSRASVYAEALAEQGIPCSFQSQEDYFSTMEISVLLALLELIDNPRQDVPLITVLRSPLLGFTPDRLAEIRSVSPDGDFYTAVEASGDQDCRDFLALLSELRLLARDMSVHRLLWHIYNRLNVLGVFGAMDRGQERRENLIALTEHAEKLESGGYCGVFSFVTQLRRLIESGRAPDTRTAAAGNGVRIMSIHRSKGLEFPIVLLCDLSHTFSRKDLEPPVLVHPKLGLGPVRVELERRIKYPTMARRAVERALDRENKSEEQRILYVAMTRAKEKLILVDGRYHAETQLKNLTSVASCPLLPEAAAAGKSFGDWILMPLVCRPEAAALRTLGGAEPAELYSGSTAPWQVEIHDAGAFAEAPDRDAGEPSGGDAQVAFDPSVLEFQYPYQRAAGMPAKLTATQLKGREADEEIAEDTLRTPRVRPLTQPRFRQETTGLTAAEAGTATHLVLQYLDLSDPDVGRQVEALRLRRLLNDQQAAAVQTEALRRFLRSPLAGELRRAKKILREYRFTLLMPASDYDPTAAADDRIMLQGIVDCCFDAGDGTLTVLDFKTDRVAGEALRARAEEYRPQLEAYSSALTRVLEMPVNRRVLYFLHTGETVEW